LAFVKRLARRADALCFIAGPISRLDAGWRCGFFRDNAVFDPSSLTAE